MPIWQEPVRQEQLALHEEGNLSLAKREGYLQKRAGKSRFRWTIRWAFHVGRTLKKGGKA